MDFKIVRLIEEPSSMVVTSGRVEGKMRSVGEGVPSFSYARRMTSGDLMYGNVAIVNNAVLYT